LLQADQAQTWLKANHDHDNRSMHAEASFRMTIKHLNPAIRLATERSTAPTPATAQVNRAADKFARPAVNHSCHTAASNPCLQDQQLHHQPTHVICQHRLLLLLAGLLSW
jgi:hypothetical protein